MFSPVGFSTTDISLLGCCVIVMGVCTSMFAGVMLNKYHKYLLMVKFSAAATFLCIGLALLTFQTKSVFWISINTIIGASFLVPAIPVCIDFTAELTYP